MSEQQIPPVADLVRRAADADPAAWHELVRRYSPVVWSVAREHRLAACDAADVSQATWLNLAEHLTRLRDPDRLAGWLATTARRESLRVLSIRRREAPLEWAELPSIVDGPEAADGDGVLWRCLLGLPERCRALLRLIAHAPELTYAQAARALGIRTGSVGPMRSRCLAVLRQRL
ncbi:MAG TPA: sigma-70 family RNA polymerase sigma factor, partial [Pseudonocardiaceae bacterium]